ncbi:MAG: two-component regulator propeller domain-containing protein, partial [bacterium]
MKRIWILLLLGILVKSGLSSDFKWKTYTSLFNINDLCYKNGIIWCATEGGIFAYDPSTQAVKEWTRQNGLANNQVNCLVSDAEGIIWLGFDNGLLQKFNIQTFEFQTIFDYQGNSITCLNAVGDSLFVGLDLGLSLYIKSRQEVKETYKQLGLDLQVELPVRDIVVEDNTIWTATEQGLAYSKLNNTNLLDPANWTNLFAENGLPSSNITGLIRYNTTIYVGTDKLLARKAGDTWENVKTDQHFRTSGVNDLSLNDTELYVLSGNGLYKLTDDRLIRIGRGFSNGISLTCTNTEIWTGTDRGLKFILQGMQDWDTFIPDCPQSNIFEDLTMDKKGNLWCAVKGGFSRFDGESWQVYDKTNLPDMQSDDMRAVVVDDFNNKWLGSWGGGIVLLKNDSTFQFFNARNDYLGGISENHDYAVVPDMTVDHNGAVWLLNYRSDERTYLISAVNDSSSGDFIWTYYNILQDSLPNCITEDFYGRKWIGTDNNGVFVIDDNNTPAIKSDDDFAGTLTKADGMESNEITSLAADKNGGVWIGTKVGLYYYYNVLNPQYQVQSLTSMRQSLS